MNEILLLIGVARNPYPYRVKRGLYKTGTVVIWPNRPAPQVLIRLCHCVMCKQKLPLVVARGLPHGSFSVIDTV